jgi:transposase
VEFVQQGTTITSEVYCEALKKLRRAISNKRRRILTSGVVTLHDNALPQTTARTRALLEHFIWELFDHPPYSPDLAPSDYHPFTRTYLKNWLESQRFSNNELMECVKTWLSSRVANFFDTRIQNLLPDARASVPSLTQTYQTKLSPWCKCLSSFFDTDIPKLTPDASASVPSLTQTYQTKLTPRCKCLSSFFDTDIPKLSPRCKCLSSFFDTDIPNKTYSPIQVPQFRRWLHWEAA